MSPFQDGQRAALAHMLSRVEAEIEDHHRESGGPCPRLSRLRAEIADELERLS